MFSMPRLARYLPLHLALKVAIRPSTLGSLLKTISMGGSALGRSLPMTPTYSSRPSMNSSTMASVPILSWMNPMRVFSASSSRTTEDCAMPTDASSSSGLTMSGKRRSLGRWMG